MQSYHIKDYSQPQGYELGQLPRPEIENATEVLIKVHAASVNPIDVKMASGAVKMMTSFKFPYKLGYDCAGTVAEIGARVTRFKVGDEVYVRLPESMRGSWSEYAKTPEDALSLKPKNVTFEEAASLPLTGLTAFQSLKLAGDLSGKTVFVPAGLSGTGAYCCQLAKNVFKAGKVITTVSTGKIPKVPELLGEGVVDQIIDYTKSDPKTEIPAGSVDFMFDTVGIAMDCLSLMRPQTGYLVSIATTPSGDLLAESGNMQIGFPFRHVLNFVDSVRVWRAKRWNVTYRYIFMHPDGKDLEELKDHVENGKLRAVVGNTVHYKDVDAVKEACNVVFKAKGGIGKQVISFK
jgi:NADPH:quinone reductase-like Zn-dependent oxidoreductase